MLSYLVESEQGWLRTQNGDEEDERASLLAEYQRMVRVELPTAAQVGGWELREGHCFARVILDTLCGGCWYERLPRKQGRSAESQLDVPQLAEAVRIGRAMLSGGAVVVARLNSQSLRWRGKSEQRPIS